MGRYVLHQFRPGDTIDAIIRAKGRYSFTRQQIETLRAEFNRLNGGVLPRQGMMFKIPLAFEVVDDFGNLVETWPSEERPVESAQSVLEGTSTAND